TLRLLALIGETGGIGQAAKRAGLSQQSVSARIRAAERRLGFPLLERGPGGSALTQQGALIRDWGVPVLAARERLAAGIDSLRGQRRQGLRLAASQTIAAHLLPGWLAELHPEATATLEVGNSERVIAEVRAGRAELGLIESSRLPGDLLLRRIGTDVLRLVVAPGHPWADGPGPDPRELSRTALVTREAGSGTRHVLEDALARAGCPAPARPALELATSEAVRGAIASGAAPGVLSALAVADDLALGRLVAVPTPGLDLSRPLTAVIRRAEPLGAAAERLLALATAPGGNLPAR
ncbi:LysR family transcriptional regulator, partial [Leucobacter sp. M11]|uniref:LysR family transcriptional regulator n=1 Tax=Leucobacter sp. M11 TaxID=2993565 RepID=UPI002D804961